MKSRRIIITVLAICAVLSCVAAVVAISSGQIIRKEKNKLIDVTPVKSSEATEDTETPSETPTATPSEEPTQEQTSEPTPEPTPDATQVVNTSGIDPDKPIVALTFDDGPAFRKSSESKSSTERILATLEKYDVHATFFVVGSMNMESLSMELEAGHEIGNHTMTHQSNFKTVGIDKVREEIDSLEDIVREHTGKGTYLVRPPWGAYTQQVLDEIPHPMILWSVDTLDWQSKNKDAVFKEVKKAVFDGAIILMHDIHASTADALELVVPWLLEQGYQVTSVSEMFEARGIPLEAGHVYSKCTPQMMADAKNGN